MAPSGYKTFSAGAILTATADVQNYLMDQVVSVHNDSSARSSAISSPAEGQVSYLKDTNKVYLYNGSAWVEVGGGIEWSGSTANGLGTYSSASEIVSESTATYDGTTLTLTQSGGGLKMDGLNSSDANTLDDYEEGYFTVAFSTGSGSITINSGTDQAYYVKVGKTVHIQGEFDISAISSPSGQLSITGLPFTAASLNESADRAWMGASLRGTATSRDGFYGWITNGASYVGFSTGNGATASDANVAEMVDTGSTLNIGGTYVAAT